MRLKLIATVAGLLLTLAATGCVRVSFGGIYSTSSQSMKRELVDSFLFHSADIFYPHGAPSNPAELPALGDKEMQEIKGILDDMLQFLLEQHSRKEATLGRFFGYPLERDVKVTLATVNTGQPVWEITPDGMITVDVKVAQAVYRSVLLTGLSELREANTEEILDPYLAGGSLPRSRPREEALTSDDAQAIANFLNLKNNVEKAPAHTAYGDLLNFLPSKEFANPDLQRMGTLMTLSKPIDRRYMRTFQFMLAHEIGHYALGHFKRTPDPDEPSPSFCDKSMAREYGADAYALLLLETTDEEPSPLYDRSYRGFEDFFEHTYEFAEFPNDGCSH